MRKKLTIAVTLATIVALLGSGLVMAKSGYVDPFVSKYGVDPGCKPGICHGDTAKIRTLYGQQLEANGSATDIYAALDAVDPLDADEDGYSNGEEILAGSDPSDPLCTPLGDCSPCRCDVWKTCGCPVTPPPLPACGDDATCCPGDAACEGETHEVGTCDCVAPAVISADLVKKSAWPEHHHFDISSELARDGNDIQTLYGLVRNTGTADITVWVEFNIYDDAGVLVATIDSDPVTLIPGAEATLSADWTAVVGKYSATAQAKWDGSGSKVKSFSFAVVP